jgi:hypothetical protein
MNTTEAGLDLLCCSLSLGSSCDTDPLRLQSQGPILSLELDNPKTLRFFNLAHIILFTPKSIISD